MPSSTPHSLSIRNATKIETVQVEASGQQLVVEVDEETATPNPSLAFEDPASEQGSMVAAVQPFINLEEELVASDVEEEPKAVVDPTSV